MYLLLLLVAFACAKKPIIHSTTGDIEGQIHEFHHHVQTFEGIPFAEAPVGPLRFAAPVPVNTWAPNTLKADSFGHACAQVDIWGKHIIEGNEDCLYLNIYRPKDTKAGDNLPILFWIYGGGYSIGSGKEFGLYDGKKWVSKYNAIIVTHNYRLEAFGFLSHKWLQEDDANGSTGNMALQDQRMALQWINDNAYNIGGDKSRITIFGESAGAFSVCYHLASQASWGLFQNAIMESGTCDAPMFFNWQVDTQNWSANWMKGVGCDDTKLNKTAWLNCIRSVPAYEILPSLLSLTKPLPMGNNSHALLYPVMPWGPTIDGSKAGLTDVPLNVISSKNWARVPVLSGTNFNEGGLFVDAMEIIVPGVSLPLHESDLQTALMYFFQDQTTINKILQYYPLANYNGVFGQTAHILTDYFFTCANYRLQSAVSSQGFDSYLYHFTYPLFGDRNLDVHATELFFVWDFILEIPLVDHKSKKMVTTFQDAWFNFANSGTPNSGDTDPQWPAYNTTTRNNYVMNVPAGVQSMLEYTNCQLWNSIPNVDPYTWHK